MKAKMFPAVLAITALIFAICSSYSLSVFGSSKYNHQLWKNAPFIRSLCLDKSSFIANEPEMAEPSLKPKWLLSRIFTSLEFKLKMYYKKVQM